LQENLNRLQDIVAVCLALPAIFPAMALLAFLIKQDSPGPVFFRQDRVGIWEKPIKVYKFRTMVNNADQMGTSVTTSEDPRITP
jgi:lipopolysaccharide/colanic/teichoic acid biosynthesis glycosyltransferase